ncbi:MAG TPA: sigma-70 family RNA polymerase sigma factor [Rariglobus sp.]|jgi:RNA polymerase sigma factor (sigma-70 family)|nr:sigma-70 family RNA polymerase sigma factor [Rariglobus sp.]
MSDDSQLLRRYAEDRSEEAFAKLVRQHLGLVYHVALRQMGDSQRAEEVAQTVFTDLARKAAILAERPSLVGWLYTSTRYAAAHARRTERRRKIREQKAYAMNDLLHPQISSFETDWTRLRPLLDDILHELDERDRDAVLLRFLEGRPFSEIGAKLALTEAAARMRVDRALEKIRKLLAQRGITSTSAVLSVALADQAGAAVPAGMAAKITSTALAMHTTASATTGLGTLVFMTTGKILTGIAVLALGTALLHQVSETQKARDALAMAQKQRTELLSKVHGLESSLATANTRLKASEDDNAKLLGVIENATANTATGTVRVPITYDYVEARYNRAQELAKAGSNEDALREFLWCYDEGMPPIAGYGGVRYSYLLQMIAKLGETYPHAITAMRERRDKAEQRILASPNDFDATMSFSSINHYLKEDARNMELYDQLEPNDPRKAALGMMVYDALTTARRYREAIQAKPYASMSSMLEALTDTSGPNAALIRQTQRTEIVKTTASYVEVLAGSGDLSHARILSARILAYDGSSEAKAILQEHAARAGHPELLGTAVTQ